LEQSWQLWPWYFQQRRGFIRSQPTMLDKPVDPNRQIGFREFDVGFGNAQVREDVAWALRQGAARHDEIVQRYSLRRVITVVSQMVLGTFFLIPPFILCTM
jgi:hypothetical protein